MMNATDFVTGCYWPPGGISHGYSAVVAELRSLFADQFFYPTWKSKHWWFGIWRITEEYEERPFVGRPCALGAMSIFDDKTICLGPSWVAEAYRGQGLHKHLIRHREAEATQLGFKRIVSATEVDNFISANNLLATGFRLCKPWSWEVGLYFEKCLEGNRPLVGQ